MERFSRTELLLGKHNLHRLQKSSVTVIGLGAVGSFAVEALARSGIGTLRLIDCDTIQYSNINRNLFALESTIGMHKAHVAYERVRAINPDCTVEALDIFACSETIDTILAPHSDFVIDAIDAVTPKVEIITAFVERNISFISSMGAAVRMNPLLVRIGDLFHVHGCPLATQLRKRLRKKGVSRGIPCVYSEERTSHTKNAHERPLSEGYDRGRKRHALGSLPTIPGMFGLMLAQYTLEQLLKR